MKTTKGAPFSVDMPSPPGQEHIFVLSAAKCGSTLMYKMLSEYLRKKGVGHTDIPQQIFKQGIAQPDLPAELYGEIDIRPTIYTGFRTLFGLEACSSFASAKKIVLVRDPRDALVSHYYSVRESHALPKEGRVRDNILATRKEAQESSVDDFITKIGRGKFIPQTLQALASLPGNNNALYRYEDVVFDKASWLVKMLEDLGLEDPDVTLAAEIAASNDIRPDAEDPTRHVRQVTPGNFARHLAPATISWIEAEYGELLDKLGYDRASATRAGHVPAGL